MNNKGIVSTTMLAVIVLVLVLVGAGTYFLLNKDGASPSGNPIATSTPITPTPPPGTSAPINITGEITCLPKKGSGPQTLECAIGLKGNNGLYYGLKNLSLYPNFAISTGTMVEVSGNFMAEEMFGPGNSRYDIAGTIDITSIKEVSISPPPGQIEKISLKEGERESSFLLQKIYPDRVTGLNYMEYPVATGQGTAVTLRIGESVSNGCTVVLTLTSIEGNVAKFNKKVDENQPCPICLAEGTSIDTPQGPMPVEKLQKGMSVWTSNAAGERVSGVIIKTSKTPVPETHRVVHVVLEDGREVYVSPGHDTKDGRRIGDLVVGDIMDGSRVVKLESQTYQKGYTYDILPSGQTGFYWAGGILLDSTLR